MAWTVKQQKAIDARHTNLLVSAAAGSGKTSVLVERIKNLINNDGVDIESMLIVTFTNAAAGEMKARLRKELGINVSHADICTFDSFAQKLIKSYYHTIGIKPNLHICDEYKKSIIADEVMDEIFKAKYDSNDSEFIDFLDHYTDSKSDKSARTMVMDFYNYVDTLPDPEAFIKSKLNNDLFDREFLFDYSCNEIQSELLKARKYNAGLAGFLYENGMPKLSEKVKTDVSMLDSILDLFSNGYKDDGLRFLGEDAKFQVLQPTKDEKEIKKQYNDIIDAYRKDGAKTSFDKAVKLASNLSLERLGTEELVIRKYADTLMKLTLEFSSEFKKKKTASGLMDFSDEAHYALKILENDNVCKELSEKYEYIFVDEYQDSNIIQDTLISKISRLDNVFLVGDVKQSIYKFRHAEPELFIEKYHKYKSGGSGNTLIDLNDNFRSKENIITHINNVFANIMTEESCGIVYDENAAMNACAESSSNICPEDPKFYLISSQSEETDEDIENLKSCELEAMMAADIIKKYHGKEFYDSKAKAIRPLEYRDMVILLRSAKGKAECFYQALTQNGIPVYMQRNEGYFDTPEIQVVLNLFRIIDNFNQDIALLSVLHFPVFGFDANALSEIKIFAKENGLNKASFAECFRYYIQNSDGEIQKKAKDFYDKIVFWKKKSDSLPLADFIWDVLFESRIIDFIAALKDSDQRLANVRALVDKASDFEQDNLGGIYAFLSYIDIISADNSSVSTGQSKIINESDDVVRIMTVHASKGLEFPFVMISSTASRLKGNNRAGRAIYDKDMGLSMVVTNKESFTKSSTKSFDIISAKKDSDEHAEEIRILYVAATRAKDFLVYTACARDAEKVLETANIGRINATSSSNFMDMVLPFVSAENVKIISRDSLPQYNADQNTNASVRNEIYSGFVIDENKLSVSSKEIEQRLSFDYSPKAADRKKKKYSVSELCQLENNNAESEMPGGDSLVPSFISGEEKVSSASLGTAYHSVMEHIEFSEKAGDVNYVREVIASLSERNILGVETKKIRPEKISNFFNSDLGRRAVSARELRKELPFTLKTVYDGREVYIQGTIDCFFTDETGNINLVDYKSNYIDWLDKDNGKERLVKEYTPQLRLYKEALETITGKKVAKVYLYLFSIDEAVEINI